MTERLRDHVDADDPALAELAQLVRAVTDLDPAIGAQERVRSGLIESQRRRRSSRVPVLVLVVLVLVAVTPVVVAGVRKLVAPEPVTPTRTAPPTTSPDPRIGKRGATAQRRPEPAVEPAATDEPTATNVESTATRDQPTGAPALQQPLVRGPAPIRGRATTPTESPGAAVIVPAQREASAAETAISDSPPTVEPQLLQQPAPPPEAALVLRALRLLRHDHDAAGALRELDSYRARFPDGDLAEEALALSIEARLAIEDAAARSLAEQYLRQFPRGRFRALAELARRRFHR
jgi:hypothetical protein